MPPAETKKVTLDRISVPKTYDVLAEQLRRTIIDGQLEEGSRLPSERELVDQTGLSRGSVREALRMLQVEGLARPRPGRFGGNIVTRPDNNSMAHFVGQFVLSRRIPLRALQETRETIEPALARLAAANRTEEDLAKLRALNEALAAPDLDAGRFAEINVTWHNTVAAASRNDLLSALLYAMSSGVIAATTFQVYDSPAIHKAVCRVHGRIFDAIAARDGDAAFRRMERHVKAAREKAKDREDGDLRLDEVDTDGAS
jgi:GntR family transcriptional regulator, transcriptional repressor for pyruvate dehydrogenase complex